MKLPLTFSASEAINFKVDPRTQRGEGTWNRLIVDASSTRCQHESLLAQWVGTRVLSVRVVTPESVWISEQPKFALTGRSVSVCGWFRSPGLRRQGLFRATGGSIVLYQEVNASKPKWQQIQPEPVEGFDQAPPSPNQWPTEWLGLPI